MGTKQNTYKNTIELKPEFLNDGKMWQSLKHLMANNSITQPLDKRKLLLPKLVNTLGKKTMHYYTVIPLLSLGSVSLYITTV